MKSFYSSLFVVDEDTLCLSMNDKDFIYDKENLGEILGVPIKGLGTI